MNENQRRITDSIRQDWVAVGSDLKTAMEEVAEELGGEDFRTRVSVVAASKDVLPDPAALILLNSNFPGSAEAVIERAELIARQRREMLTKDASRPAKKLKALGQGMLRVFG